MQQIKFTTSFGAVTINDNDTSEINGESCALWLNDFDGNSQSLNIDTIECIGIAGQRVVNSVPKARTITAKIGFAPLYCSQNAIVCTGESGKFQLRRELLKLFPLGEVGELNYKNSFGEYRIKARISESPRISYTAGPWAEATVTFVADYPYWTYPLTESPEISISAGETGVITPTECGDIDSPIEVIVTCTEKITGSGESSRIKITRGVQSSSYLLGVNCVSDILAGVVLKYDIGTIGELMCYRWYSTRWASEGRGMEVRGYERDVCCTTTLDPINIYIASGAATAKVIYHNIVTAI